MALDITAQLLRIGFWLYTVALVLRFMLHITNADYYNPLSQQIVRITQLPVGLFQRFLPTLGPVDLGTLGAAILCGLSAIVCQAALHGYSLDGQWGSAVLWSMIGIAHLTLDIAFFCLLLSIIMSWLNPHQSHPALMLCQQLVAPMMAPIQRLMPSFGGLDFSPIVLFVLINVGEVMLRQWAIQLGLPFRLVVGVSN